MSNGDDAEARGGRRDEFLEVFNGRQQVGSFRIGSADDAGTNGSGSEALKDPEQPVPPGATDVADWAPQQFKAAGIALMPSHLCSATRALHRCGMDAHGEMLELLCEYFNWQHNDKRIPPAAWVSRETLEIRCGYSAAHVHRVIKDFIRWQMVRRPTEKDRKRFRDGGLEGTLRGRGSLILQPPELWKLPENARWIQAGQEKRATTVREQFEYRQAHPKEKSRSKRK